MTCWLPPGWGRSTPLTRGMTRRLCYALVVVLAPAFPAAAQSVATPGGLTRSGVVILGSRKLAVLTIGRDCDNLAAEIELEKTIAAGS